MKRSTYPPIRPAPAGGWPSTWLGRLSGALALTSLVLFVVEDIALQPAVGGMDPWLRTLTADLALATLLGWFAAGVTGIIAIVQERERSWLVFLSTLPIASALVLIVAEWVLPY